MTLKYAVLTKQGDLVDVVDSLPHAIAQARALDAGTVWVDAPMDSPGRAEPNIDPTVMPQKAMRAAKLTAVSAAEVAAVTEDFTDFSRCHAALRKFFPRKSPSYDTAPGMADELLGQNYKTSKQIHGYAAKVYGLSLAPYWKAFDTSPGDGRAPADTPNLCIGSNRECRAACLVSTGQNVATLRSIEVKLDRTWALWQHPVEFCGMLVFAVGKFIKRAERQGFEPHVRLNVYSDIPWELFFPDLFGLFPAVQFYDYTKVPARAGPDNYDLTFSYSGTNEGLARYELARGQRVAAVFLWKRKVPFPRGLKLWGHKVIEGDYPKGEFDWGGNGDMRSRDPAPCIVGLRYKKPRRTSPDVGSFVVAVREHVDGLWTTTSNAEQTHAQDFQGDD